MPPVLIREDQPDSLPQLSLIKALIDPLPQHVAVLNRGGLILATNKAWRSFGLNNGARDLRRSGTGCSYIEECKRAAEAGVEDAARVLEGLTQVLHAETVSFFYEYSCDAPGIERWFSLCASPILTGGFQGAMVSHSLSTAEHRARLRLEAEGRLHEHPERRTICSQCKRIRQAGDGWQDIEDFVNQKYRERFSHGLCLSCTEELYPDIAE
ncbi:hypothetical protein IT575_13060 [bacterium]|nr:hypothetical protein [bacterium]